MLKLLTICFCVESNRSEGLLLILKQVSWLSKGVVGQNEMDFFKTESQLEM